MKCGAMGSGLLVLAMWATVSAAPVRVVEYGQGLSTRGLDGDSPVWLANLAQGSEGMLFDGEAAARLEPGRYRLHALLAVAPRDDVMTSMVEITLAAGNRRRQIGTLHFAAPDQWEPITLDFVVDPAARRTPIAITWQFTHVDGKLARLRLQTDQAVKAPEIKEAPEDDLVGELLAAEGDDGRVPLGDARNTKYRLLLADVAIERLGPAAVEQVRTDRVLYRPGEPATAVVRLKNYSTRPQAVEVAAALHGGLDFARPLDETKMTLAPGAEETWQVAFSTEGLRWGYDLQVTARTADGCVASGRDSFSVTNRPWEVAMIGGNPGRGSTTAYENPQSADALMEKFREQGFNGFEMFFWAPCDMLDFTPDEELFFSSQTGYPATRTSTKNLIDAAHRQGMVATVYANLWGGGGPPTYDVMQKHPDWFGAVNFDTRQLENWDLLGDGRGAMGDKQIRAPGLATWCFAAVNADPADEIFQLHARELIDSRRQFGWDGVRYDSAYAVDWSVHAMKVIWEMIARESPGYLMGYNAFAPSDQRMGANDILLTRTGGGMVMAEGLRMERAAKYVHWADEALKWREACWPYDGHLGPLYATSNDLNDKKNIVMTPLDQVCYSTLYLATGSHPYYAPLEGQVGEHQRFGRRYAEFVYDNQLRPLQHPEQVVTFGQNAEFFRWKPLARTRTLEGDRRRLIVHLFNADENGDAYYNFAMKRPPVVRDLKVKLRLPPQAEVEGAWLLRAVPEAEHRAVEVKAAGEGVELTVDEVRFWTVLVVDFSSPAPLETPLTLKDLSDSHLQRWYLAGPFPNPGAEQAGFTTVYGPEKNPGRFDRAEQFEGAAGKIGWKPIFKEDTPPQGPDLIDLRDTYGRQGEICTYAATTVTVEEGRHAVIYASATGGVVLWLNGERVFEKKTEQQNTPLDMYRVPVELKAGKNTILLKLCEQSHGWGFRVRLATPEGAPLPGMKFPTLAEEP